MRLKWHRSRQRATVIYPPSETEAAPVPGNMDGRFLYFLGFFPKVAPETAFVDERRENKIFRRACEYHPDK